jgi:hypothetical protein
MNGVAAAMAFEAQKAVGAELQHDAGEDHRATGRRLDVGIGQPRVQREHRHLHGEGEREGGEEPALLHGAQRHVVEQAHVEGRGTAVPHVHRHQVEDREQHQQARGQRVDEELERRVDPARPAPDADDEVHRHEHELPEDVEEEEVERDERAEHARFQHQHEEEVLLHALLHVAEREEDDDRREEGRKQHEEEAHAVDADHVLDAPLRHPLVLLEELELGGVGTEAGPQRERQEERHEREHERGAPGAVDLLARQQQQEQRADHRRPDDEAQQHVAGWDRLHRWIHRTT